VLGDVSMDGHRSTSQLFLIVMGRLLGGSGVSGTLGEERGLFRGAMEWLAEMGPSRSDEPLAKLKKESRRRKFMIYVVTLLPKFPVEGTKLRPDLPLCFRTKSVLPVIETMSGWRGSER
jgi:hypothetical protein